MTHSSQNQPLQSLALDANAFLRDFGELSRIGGTDGGGVERQAGSEAYRQARCWLSDWLDARGFTVTTDNIGNLFGWLEWQPGAPVILAGSHLDSQPLGGRYDGAYGVLVAAHAAHRVRRYVQELGKPLPYNIAVVDWFNEEGSRFKPSMMGSGVLTGKFALEAALETSDKDGITISDLLDSIRVRELGNPPVVRAYAEIHVEQGRVLEDAGIDIGLVTSTWAVRKYDVMVQGEQSHTGATLLEDRHDALLGAARLIVAARELAEVHSDPAVLTSVGEIEVLPNSPVVVPRRVRMALDIRSPDAELLAATDAELRERVSLIEDGVRVSIAMTPVHEWAVQSYQDTGVALARDAADTLGLSHREMSTLAGHDSTNLKDVTPTIMMFVPSVGGVAHNEAEFTRDEDCIRGLDLMTEVLTRLCSGALDETPA
jgi:N-carbamoyl-L-amino-acid hydrolase